MTLYKLNSVSYTYPGRLQVEALKQISLELNRNEFVVIFGKSGSGKTTLLKTLGMLLTPTGGEMLFDGKVCTDLSENQRCHLRRNSIGFLFQSFDLFPELTAYENIKLPLLLAKKEREIKNIDELADQLGIQGLLNKYPLQLSGGEQQRVAMSRALIHRPDILLCDEPTGNLDEENANNIIQLIRKLNTQTQTTVVLVTHDQDIAQYATQKIHIVDGCII